MPGPFRLLTALMYAGYMRVVRRVMTRANTESLTRSSGVKPGPRTSLCWMSVIPRERRDGCGVAPCSSRGASLAAKASTANLTLSRILLMVGVGIQLCGGGGGGHGRRRRVHIGRRGHLDAADLSGSRRTVNVRKGCMEGHCHASVSTADPCAASSVRATSNNALRPSGAHYDPARPDHISFIEIQINRSHPPTPACCSLLRSNASPARSARHRPHPKRTSLPSLKHRALSTADKSGRRSVTSPDGRLAQGHHIISVEFILCLRYVHRVQWNPTMRFPWNAHARNVDRYGMESRIACTCPRGV